MSETKYVRSYYLAEVNPHFSALQCQGWLLQTIFLLCQLDGQEAPPIRGAKGDKSGGTRDLFLPISQFASSHCFFNPAVAIFQYWLNAIFPALGEPVSSPPFRHQQSAGAPPLEPGPMGPTPAQETAPHEEPHLLNGLSFSNNSNHLLRSLTERWPSSCSCYLWYLEFFSPFLIFNLVNIFSYPDL